MESMGVASGCGCKDVYIFSHITYPYPLVSALFCSSIPTFCSLKKNVFLSFIYRRNKGKVANKETVRWTPNMKENILPKILFHQQRKIALECVKQRNSQMDAQYEREYTSKDSVSPAEDNSIRMCQTKKQSDDSQYEREYTSKILFHQRRIIALECVENHTL